MIIFTVFKWSHVVYSKLWGYVTISRFHFEFWRQFLFEFFELKIWKGRKWNSKSRFLKIQRNVVTIFVCKQRHLYSDISIVSQEKYSWSSINKTYIRKYFLKGFRSIPNCTIYCLNSVTIRPRSFNQVLLKISFKIKKIK